MIYTHVLNRGRAWVVSPVDGLTTDWPAANAAAIADFNGRVEREGFFRWLAAVLKTAAPRV